MYLLEVEPLDLGPDVKAVGLELTEPESCEPVRGSDAARVWAITLTACAGAEPWALDFFSHLDRVREWCARHGATPREAATRCLVLPAPDGDKLTALFARFAGETFGARCGPGIAGDPGLEADLSKRGVDGYHHAYAAYLFCAVCDFENGFLTLLTNRLHASEVVRRTAAALRALEVEVRLP
jgi:hypothetical protein